MTEYIVGLSITSLAGSTWRIAPQFGDLTHAEGGFTTSLGKYSVSWTKNDDDTFTLDYDVPQGTSGVLVLPASSKGQKYRVTVDGQAVMVTHGMSIEAEGSRQLYITEGTGGQHHIEVS